jgi:hypothetical protein
MQNIQSKNLKPKEKGLMRTYLENRAKNPAKRELYTIKVLDFTIWNGLKFGIGLVFGVISAFIMLAIAGKLLELLFLGLSVSQYLPT